MQHADARLAPLRDSLVGQVVRGSGGTAYHLRECIGEGGQGWIFRANWDDPAGHVVIVKVLRPDVVATEALRRFHREAEVLRMLSTQGRPNPYIVRFFDHAVARVPSPFGSDQLSLPFTVLEYVDGTTLEKVLGEASGRGLPAERVRRLLRQICQALDVVHAQKVVHRDLKPSNILLATEAGVEIAKVTDFGLVKLVEVSLQRTSALAGASLGYAPPEQYEQGNQRVSPRTDVFSLAAVTFEMLTGKPAFPFKDAENPLLIVTRILKDPRPSLLKHRSTLSPELELAPRALEDLDRELARALAADPSARHDSALAFWTAIEPPLRAAIEEKVQGPVALSSRPVSPFEATVRQPEESAPNPSGSSGVRNVEVEVTQPLERPRVAEARAADAAAWSFTILTPRIAPGALRCVSWNATGEQAIAMANNGLLRWERGGWIPSPLPANIPISQVRGLRWMRDGAVLLFGNGSLVARHVIHGPTAIWRVPDPEITFHGALVEDNGTTTLVGERPYRGSAPRNVPGKSAGVVAQFVGDRITVVGDAMNSTRLHGITRLMSGQLVSCGEFGTLVRVEMGIVEHVGSVCAGHLLSIARLPDGGAIAVGAGGHALTLNAKLTATLEAVQTTKDLIALSIGDDGTAWAGSTQARVLRRTPLHGVRWVRMNKHETGSASMIGVAALPNAIRAIGDDGMVVEGRL